VPKRSRHAHGIPPELGAILDWYYDRLDDPSIQSVLLGQGPHKCPYCEVEIGTTHKVGCPYAGQMFAGLTSPRRGGIEPEVIVSARRQAAVGTALGRLAEEELRAVEAAWVARRQLALFRGKLTNIHHGDPVRMPANCTSCPVWKRAHMTQREINSEVLWWVQQWQARKRRQACKAGIGKLDEERKRGAIW